MKSNKIYKKKEINCLISWLKNIYLYLISLFKKVCFFKLIYHNKSINWINKLDQLIEYRYIFFNYLLNHYGKCVKSIQHIYNFNYFFLIFNTFFLFYFKYIHLLVHFFFFRTYYSKFFIYFFIIT